MNLIRREESGKFALLRQLEMLESVKGTKMIKTCVDKDLEFE
jgi:hypothetical protein